MVAHFFLYVGLFLKCVFESNPMTIVGIFFHFIIAFSKKSLESMMFIEAIHPSLFTWTMEITSWRPQLGCLGFLIGLTLFALSLKLYVSFRLSSSSWCFLNVCLHELNYHFWLLKCICNVDGLQFVTFINESLLNVVCMHIGIFLESIKGGWNVQPLTC